MADESFEFSGRTVEEAIESGLRSLGLAHDDVTVDILNRGSRGILGFGAEEATVRISKIKATSTADDAGHGHAGAADQKTESGSSEPAEPMAEDDVGQEDDAENDVPAETVHPTDELNGSDDAEKDSGTVDDQQLIVIAKEMLGELIRLMGFSSQIEAEWKSPDGEGEGRYLFLDIQGEDVGALIGRRGETLAAIQYLLRLMINQRLRQWKNIVRLMLSNTRNDVLCN